VIELALVVEEERRLPGFDRGAPFIQKPFTKATLTAKVRDVLHGDKTEP